MISQIGLLRKKAKPVKAQSKVPTQPFLSIYPALRVKVWCGVDKSLGRAGFTLIELLIVCAIILALVSISTPLFRGTFAALELRETASNISKFIMLAQHRAIVDRLIYKIAFDLENKNYRLFASSGEGENVKYDSPKERFGRVFYVPRDIDIEWAASEGKTAEVFFYPDGRCDKVELRLKGKDNKVLKIVTTGVLGNVIVTEEK